MTWLDEYKQPSFRGVTFAVSSHTHDSGRRVVTHRYPRSDMQRNEDLGLDADEFTMRCKVVGRDYHTRRDELESALRQGGSGTLVHPTYGELLVFVKSYSVREGLPNTGVAYFTVTFVRELAGTVTVSADVTRQVELAAESIYSATEQWMDDSYSIQGMQRTTIADARSTLDGSFSFIDKAKQSAQSVAEFKRSISNAKGAVISLSLSGAAIARTYRGLITFTQQEVDSITPRDRISELQRIYNYTLTPTVTTSAAISSSLDYPARKIQTALAYTAVASMAVLIPHVEYGSVNDAENYQKDLFDAIDHLSNVEGIDDRVYSSLRDCRSTVYAFFDKKAITLPRLIEYRLAQGDNALSLAYRLYGDFERGDEIADLNGLSHPGFVPQGRTIRIRTND